MREIIPNSTSIARSKLLSGWQGIFSQTSCLLSRQKVGFCKMIDQRHKPPYLLILRHLASWPKK